MSEIEKLCRPIVGIEHRTALEVFDIMSDRIRRAQSDYDARIRSAIGEPENLDARLKAAEMVTTLQEKLKMAEDALEPFAEAGDELGGSHLDKSDIWESHVAMNITAGDLRRARTTISQIRSEK